MEMAVVRSGIEKQVQFYYRSDHAMESTISKVDIGDNNEGGVRGPKLILMQDGTQM